MREKAFENIDVADLPDEPENEFRIVKHKKFPVHAADEFAGAPVLHL